MKARTPSQGGNLLSALRGMIRWMIDEGHLDEDDDPTIGLRSGKAKASRESGGGLAWSPGDTEGSRREWARGAPEPPLPTPPHHAPAPAHRHPLCPPHT